MMGLPHRGDVHVPAPVPVLQIKRIAMNFADHTPHDRASESAPPLLLPNHHHHHDSTLFDLPCFLLLHSQDLKLNTEFADRVFLRWDSMSLHNKLNSIAQFPVDLPNELPWRVIEFSSSSTFEADKTMEEEKKSIEVPLSVHVLKHRITVPSNDIASVLQDLYHVHTATAPLPNRISDPTSWIARIYSNVVNISPAHNNEDKSECIPPLSLSPSVSQYELDTLSNGSELDSVCCPLLIETTWPACDNNELTFNQTTALTIRIPVSFSPSSFTTQNSPDTSSSSIPSFGSPCGSWPSSSSCSLSAASRVLSPFSLNINGSETHYLTFVSECGVVTVPIQEEMIDNTTRTKPTDFRTLRCCSPINWAQLFPHAYATRRCVLILYKLTLSNGHSMHGLISISDQPTSLQHILANQVLLPITSSTCQTFVSVSSELQQMHPGPEKAAICRIISSLSRQILLRSSCLRSYLSQLSTSSDSATSASSSSKLVAPNCPSYLSSYYLCGGEYYAGVASILSESLSNHSTLQKAAEGFNTEQARQLDSQALNLFSALSFAMFEPHQPM